ncbi:hypothetical protein PXD04_11710 [Methanosphaera sp. ISO3-F5]|uniref:hypothetical protein n=1 Tax=Methanosphaera sp. ISO3-F5 TaxID=1452353 RepID=UPI002B25E11D|nr:hypothetical protein [Methanosphaera sp. ISO3-F5]
MNYIAELYVTMGKTVGIVTSAPAMIHQLNNDEQWRLTFQGRNSPHSLSQLKSTSSSNRFTCSYKYIPK